MEYNVKQFKENTWIIEEGFVRFFLLTGEKEALLIDSGMQLGKARETAEAITSLPIKLLNTHADPDHTGSNFQFEVVYMHQNEIENYRKHGAKEKIQFVEDGEIIELGNRPLEIIHLPGHTPGSIAILDINGKLLFSGDTVQKESEIFMFGERRNLGDYVKSLEKINSMASCFDLVLACHGEIPFEKGFIEELLEGSKKVLADVLAGKEIGISKTMPFGAQVKLCDAGCAKLLIQQ